MKQHRIGAAVGILLLGLAIPLLMSLFHSAKAMLILGYLWGITVFPFTIYLGIICGKYIRKMWFYPLVYAAALLGVHIFSNGGQLDMDSAGLLIGMSAVSVCLMLLQALKKRNKEKSA